MKYGFNSLAILITLTFGYGSVFGADIPFEIKRLRNKAIADSMEVCMSAEKLKATYTILEAEETAQTATYKVADMPRKGIHATVVYRVNPRATPDIYKEIGEVPSFNKREEYEAWKALFKDKMKKFPKPFPVSVVCVDNKTGDQTKYEFRHEKGQLSQYMEHFDEKTQLVFIQFHANYQMAKFEKVQNNAPTGWEYVLDEKGNAIIAVDHGLSPNRRQPIEEDEEVFSLPIKRRKPN